MRIDAWLQKAAGTGWLLRHHGLAALAQLRPRALAGLAAIAAAPDRALKNSNHGDGILPSLSTRSLISAGASSTMKMLTLLAAPARTRSSGVCWPWRATTLQGQIFILPASLSTWEIPPVLPASQSISQRLDRRWLLPAEKISHHSQPADKQVLGKITQTLFPKKFGPFFAPLFDPLLLSDTLPNYTVPLLIIMNWPPWQGRLDISCPTLTNYQKSSLSTVAQPCPARAKKW